MSSKSSGDTMSKLEVVVVSRLMSIPAATSASRDLDAAAAAVSVSCGVSVAASASARAIITALRAASTEWRDAVPALPFVAADVGMILLLTAGFHSD